MAHKYFRKILIIGRKNQFKNLPPFSTSARCSQSPAQLDTPATEMVRISGYPIHYVKSGQGPHVVFCFPGILGNMKIHTVSQIQNFDREKFTFVTWDQPGYGRSTPPERKIHDQSLIEDTDIMIEFMRSLGFQKYSIMGWSGGGCSALIAAIKHPEIVQKLVLWGTFAYVDEKDSQIYKYFQTKENRRGKMMEMLVDEYGEEFFGKHFNGWMEVFSRIFTHHGGEFISKELRKINCPTLIMHGSKDGLILPIHGEYLETNIKKSQLIKWEGGKHNLHLRYPDEFNRLVQNFLLEEE